MLLPRWSTCYSASDTESFFSSTKEQNHELNNGNAAPPYGELREIKCGSNSQPNDDHQLNKEQQNECQSSAVLLPL